MDVRAVLPPSAKSASDRFLVTTIHCHHGRGRGTSGNTNHDDRAVLTHVYPAPESRRKVVPCLLFAEYLGDCRDGGWWHADTELAPSYPSRVFVTQGGRGGTRDGCVSDNEDKIS